MELKKRLLEGVGHPNSLTMFRIAAVPLLIHYNYFGIDFHAIGYVLLWIALIITAWSGVDCFVRFRKLLTY